MTVNNKNITDKEKAIIWGNLTLSKRNIKKPDLKKFLCKMQSSQAKVIPFKKIEVKDIALVFNFFDYEIPSIKKHIALVRKQSEEAIRQKVTGLNVYFKKIFGNDYIGRAFTERESNDKLNNSDVNKGKRKIKRSIEGIKGVLSFFNLSSDDLTRRLEVISLDTTVTNEDYLKQLYLLREIFIAKAKGELTTRQTEIIYEVSDKSGQIVKKNIRENDIGKQYVIVKSQSHLPSEKALIGAKLVDEMILQVTNSSEITIDNEELNKIYTDYLKDTETQKQAVLERRTASTSVK